MELAAHGHKVHVFTSHHDKTRCFEETLSGKMGNCSNICIADISLVMGIDFMNIFDKYKG